MAFPETVGPEASALDQPLSTRGSGGLACFFGGWLSFHLALSVILPPVRAGFHGPLAALSAPQPVLHLRDWKIIRHG
jgi:hypothetical protein